MEEKIVAVVNEMAEVLNVAQLKKLQEVLLKNFNENTKFDKHDNIFTRDKTYEKTTTSPN